MADSIIFCSSSRMKFTADEMAGVTVMIELLFCPGGAVGTEEIGLAVTTSCGLTGLGGSGGGAGSSRGAG
jgi:hypothetical protein